MNIYRFAEPQWLHLVWFVPAIATVMIVGWLRSRKLLARFLSRLMQMRLVRSVPLSLMIAGQILIQVSLLLLIAALMRPQWGLETRTVSRVGAQIMICLDVSRSMLAEDAIPNRLDRAKAEIMDLLDLLKGEQVGLIAFAGQAAVLSPMTSDFGFLKLALKNAGPGIIGRGGTRLEEPIRKAVVGMEINAEMARVVLLITDGEDLDSHPLDAAESARERGIRIITIGFGDEAGSRILVTNPATGAREYVRDDQGQPVVSRLNGEVLREIALKTDGAYIPAGTGALDLTSIYQAHIAPLVRAAYGRTEQEVRHEAYQVFVGSALAALLLGLAIRNGGSRPLRPDVLLSVSLPVSMTDRSLARTVTIGLVCLPTFLGSAGRVLQAQDTVPAFPSDTRTEETLAPSNSAAAEAQPESIKDPGTPRQKYNRALSLLATKDIKASDLLESARSEAATDGDLRFNASFNLGWLTASRAEEFSQSDPSQALDLLRTASDWFREAVRLRPKDSEARYNLELVATRLAQLEDAQRARDELSIEQELDQLIKQQREFTTLVAEQVVIPRPDADVNSASTLLQQTFRDLATRQRILLDRVHQLSRRIHDEGDELQSGPGTTGKPHDPSENAQRVAQLKAVQAYLQSAEQRLGQARQQLRIRIAERAHRRASLGLNELKQSRDQLRTPPDRIRSLLFDLELSNQLTRIVVAATDDEPRQSKRPAWLSDAYLRESQHAVTQRTKELSEQLRHGVESSAKNPTNPASQDPDQARQLEQRQILLSAVADLVFQATDSLDQADHEIRAGHWSLVSDHQRRAISQLGAALELFLDVRGLIEVIYRDELTLTPLLDPTWGAPVYSRSIPLRPHLLVAPLPSVLPPAMLELPLPESVASAILKRTKEVQIRNLPRVERLSQAIARELERTVRHENVGPPPPPGTNSTTTDADKKAKLIGEQYEHGRTLTHRLQEQVLALIQVTREPSNPETPISHVVTDWKELMETLEKLRRLFYTLIDHLRETAELQQRLNDETFDKLNGDPDKKSEKIATIVGPLKQRQDLLRGKANEIAKELRRMTESPDTRNEVSAADQADPEKANVRKKMEQATAAVVSASEQMREALAGLEPPVPEDTAVAKAQDKAAAELHRALELLKSLDPSQDKSDSSQQQQQQQPQEQDQGDSGSPSGGQDQPQDPTDEGQPGMERLLQLIRDRDAQRQQDRAKRSRTREPVTRDW